MVVSDPAESLRRLPPAALWALAARLKTLGLSVTPVLAGTWLAVRAGSWRPDVLAAALVSAMAIQIGTNLWNDAADAASGVDAGERLGPPRMTALGLLGAGEVRAGAAAAFLVAALAGSWLVVLGGWPIAAIGVVSLALGYLYSMGPFPLSATPVGELLVIAFFGVVAVAGTVWLHGAPVTPDVLSAGFFLGLPAASVLLVNNHRDRVSDAAGGRRTLAILIGENASRAAFSALNLSAFGGLLWVHGVCRDNALAIAAVAIFALYLSWLMAILAVSRALNGVLALTALYQFALLAAFALGDWACR
jgi:1,4-dihydroxy-2-naphthoate octaprenyltransferase